MKRRSSCHRKKHTFDKLNDEQRQVEIQTFYAKRRGDLDASRALVEQQREQHKEDHAQSASSSAAVAAPYKFDFGKCKGLNCNHDPLPARAGAHRGRYDS